MAASVLDSGTYTFTTQNDSRSIAIPSGSQALFVFVFRRDAGGAARDVTSVTYDAVALDAVSAGNNGNPQQVEAWEIAGTLPTSATLAVNTDGTASYTVIWVACTAVDTTTPSGTPATPGSGSGTSSSLNVTSTTSGGLVLDALCKASTAEAVTVGANQTQVEQEANTDGFYIAAVSSEPGNDGTVAMSWSWSNSRSFVHLSFEVNEGDPPAEPELDAPSEVAVDEDGWVTWTNGEELDVKWYGQITGEEVEVLGVCAYDQEQPYQILGQDMPGDWTIWATHIEGDSEAPTDESAASNTDTVTIAVAATAPSISVQLLNGDPVLVVGPSDNADTIVIDRDTVDTFDSVDLTEIHDFTNTTGGQFTDTTADPATQYFYRAVAEATAGDAESETVSITTPPAPPDTADFTATSFYGGTVEHNAGSVEVRCNLAGDDLSEWEFVIPDDASFPYAVPFVLEPEVEYTPTFRSIGVDGNSAPFVGTADTTDAKTGEAVLVFVGNASNLTTGDTVLTGLIDGQHRYTGVAVSGTQEPLPSFATYDALVVAPSSSVVEYDQINAFAGPVLGLRFAVNLLLAPSGVVTPTARTSVTVVDDEHPMAVGYSGSTTILGSSQNVSGCPTASLPGGAIPIATKGTDDWFLYGVDTGGALADSSQAPGPRVAMLFNADASLAEINTAGGALVLGAISWMVGGTHILFKVFDAENLATDEQDIATLLEGAGYTVHLATRTEDEASAGAYAGALISTRVGAAALGTKYLNWTKPVVLISDNDNNVKNQNILSTAGGLASADSDSIVITTEAHPVAAGLADGSHTIATQAEGQAGDAAARFGGGGVLVGARGSAATSFCLVAYEAGSAMANSFTAPARRVWIGWRSDMFASWNSTGESILLAAVAWGAPAPVAATEFDEVQEGEDLGQGIGLEYELEPILEGDVLQPLTDEVSGIFHVLTPIREGEQLVGPGITYQLPVMLEGTVIRSLNVGQTGSGGGGVARRRHRRAAIIAARA